MNAWMLLLLGPAMQGAVPPPQAPPPVEQRLRALPDLRPHALKVGYKFGYTSSRGGKPTESIRDAGELAFGTAEAGIVWAGSPVNAGPLPMGELPSSKGRAWFGELQGARRMAPFADAKPFLLALLRDLPLKGVEPPPSGKGEPGDLILVFRLEAPRPGARLWTFKTHSGEARLHVRADGSAVSLRVVQAYAGRLNPHFGPYTLDRAEEWTFESNAGGVAATRFQVHVKRRDWKDAMAAEVVMTRGERP